LSALDEHAATHGTPDAPLDEPEGGADGQVSDDGVEDGGPAGE
jgi:hypothetical protein